MADSRIRVLGATLAHYLLPLLTALGWQYPTLTWLMFVILWDARRPGTGAWPTVLALLGLIAVVGTLY